MEDYRYALTPKAPLDEPSCCAITPADISKTAGFDTFEALCSRWGLPLALNKTYTYRAYPDDAHEWNLHVHQELLKQCQVEIGWRRPIDLDSFRQEGVGPFCLREAECIIVHHALQFLTLVSQYCALTLEEAHLLNQASSALAELGTHAPEIGITCKLSIRLSSQEVSSRLSWGLLLTPNLFLLSWGGTIKGNSLTLPLPAVAFEFGWDHRRHALKGSFEDCMDKLEEILGLQPPSVELPGFQVQTKIYHSVKEFVS
jgi:hypothetical protein